MKPVLKVVVVATGYVAACLLASIAVAIRIANTSGPAAQASSGMYAFGDTVLFVAVFGISSLVPTALGLFFLRPYPRFWVAFSAFCVAVAVTGVTAAALFLIGRHVPSPSPLSILAGLSVLRILLAPLLASAFLVCALLAPLRSARIALLSAMAAEVAVSACGVLAWVVPLAL